MSLRYLLFLFIFSSGMNVFGQVPTMDCPSTTSYLATSGACGEVITYSVPTCNSNCTDATISQTDVTGLSSGDFFPIGSTTLEYTITGPGGNSSCTFDIIVKDVTAPVITCPSTQDLYMDSNCEAVLPDYTGLASISDECDPALVVITQSPANGTLISTTGAQTITLQAEDTAKNISFCTFTVQVSDTISPSVSCPGDQTVSATTGCDAILGDYTGIIVTSDNCTGAPVVTQSPAAGTSITTSQVVTITSTDESGNSSSCSFLVIVDDVIAPTITCAPDTTLGVDGSCDYVLGDFTSLVTATDNCDPSPTINQIPAPGTIISGTGSQFISFSVVDVASNTSFCSFTLTLVDTTGPTITCPTGISEYIDGGCSFSLGDYTSLATATDNCSGAVFLSQSPIPGTIVNGSDSPVEITITAQDGIGNLSNCTFEVTLLDTINPSIVQCANDTIVAADANCEYLVGDFSGMISGTDNCSGTFTVTQSLAPGSSLLAGGPYPITMYLADEGGNLDSCTFNITVNDVTSPTLDCPLNPDVPASPSCAYIVPSYDTVLNITDNCSGFTFTQSVAAGTLITGIGTQQTVNIFVTDVEGNNNSCSFTFTVVDTTRPDITCPVDQALDINGLCQYTIPDFTGSALVADFCDPSPTISQNIGVGVVTDGINTIILTALDASGNTATCSFTISPNDTVAPTITCPGNISSCDDIITYTSPVGSDNCTTVTTTQTDATGLSSGDSFPVGISTIEFTATDLVGNTAICSFDVTVYEPVSLDAGTSTTIDEGDSLTIDATISNATSIIWSPNYNIDSINVQNPTVSPGVTTFYTVSAVSPDGCMASDSVFIIVNTVNELVINNFFSPNGDGSNETWNVNKPALISGCWVVIYNRWGRKVWESNSYDNDWDGTNISGEPLPEGTYYYVISCGSGEPTKGSVLLMR